MVAELDLGQVKKSLNISAKENIHLTASLKFNGNNYSVNLIVKVAGVWKETCQNTSLAVFLCLLNCMFQSTAKVTEIKKTNAHKTSRSLRYLGLKSVQNI